MNIPLCFLILMLFTGTSQACIWDADTFLQEKIRSHDLAETILGGPPAPEDAQKLQERITNLKNNPDENNPDWWNNLAGAYLRLGQPGEAVKLLKPIVHEFPNDYGIHANLGTAYHLSGHYQEAEREIARDLEINPEAHFGLEKYHLALLQYLVRDSRYRSRHVYVDEFTAPFLASSGRGPFYFNDGFEQINKLKARDYTNAAEAQGALDTFLKTPHEDYETMKMLGIVAVVDDPPPYRSKWNLANDTNFEAGVIYMAQMNPKEPACFTMLGIAAWKKRDYHLAVTAFERAIALGSPQSELLKRKIAGLKDYISHSPILPQSAAYDFIFLVLVSILLLISYYIYEKIRNGRHKHPTPL